MKNKSIIAIEFTGFEIFETLSLDIFQLGNWIWNIKCSLHHNILLLLILKMCVGWDKITFLSTACLFFKGGVRQNVRKGSMNFIPVNNIDSNH